MALYDDEMMADLATMDEEFVEAAPAERRAGGNDVPDGTYQVTIDKLFFDRAQRDKTKILLKWELLVAAGEHANAVLYRNNSTATPDNMRWLKADLLAAGLDTDGMRMSDIPQHLDSLLDVMLEVTVKRRGTGDDTQVNIYINRRVDRETDAAPANSRGAAPAQNSRAPRTTTTPARTTNTSASGANSARTGGNGRGLKRF